MDKANIHEMLFIHCRYVADDMREHPIYIFRKGVLKRASRRLYGRSNFINEDYWYSLDDLPLEQREELLHMSISYDELTHYNKKSGRVILDDEEVKVVVSGDTPVLPIVGNFLPSDDISAYTVVTDECGLSLRPILVCWDCHWSELFTGQTKYKENVFCLACDLDAEAIQNYLDDIILLEEVPEYLASIEEPEEEKRLEFK